MGHTVWSQRVVLDILLQELKDYGRALGGEDRELYERILKEPLKHVGSISFANSIHVWAFLLLSILIEQERKIEHIEELYESLVDGCVQERELYSVVDKDS
jgi:hypothetical protein